MPRRRLVRRTYARRRASSRIYGRGIKFTRRPRRVIRRRRY